jgi:putative ubiquitin-RnfH superfamily antitoxin RatB of RatAB toxin-antitoxin module
MTIKVGTFPGRLNEYAVAEGTTVKEALALAGIEVGEEQEIKLDGSVVGADDVITNNNAILLVTKRIKGN